MLSVFKKYILGDKNMGDIIINTDIIFMDICPFLEKNFKNKKLHEMGINSILFVKIVVALENHFNFEFDDEDLNYDKFETMNDVYEYIKEKTYIGGK